MKMAPFVRLALGCAVVVVAASAAACADDAPPCGEATAVSHDGVEYCVAASPIIETGFMCPPDLPFMYPGQGYTLCSPVGDMSPGQVGAVAQQAGFGPTSRKLDVVIVVDNSTSMCDEQNAFGVAFDQLGAELARIGIDVRVGVTTVDMECPVDNAGVHSAGGRFNGVAARLFPPSCDHSVVALCEDDGDCDDALGGAGSWSCQAPASAICAENPNGSINSRCFRRCADDAECRLALGDEAAECRALTSRCYLPPKTSDCPDPVISGGRAWLQTDELDLLRCLGTVGVNQLQCFPYEQGLAAAWAAIEPLGPNAQQSADFLRDDAHLAVLVVSDEDDCSVAAGQELDESSFDRCALLPDTTDGGPLEPTLELASRFLALKGPGLEVFAAVASGDSLAPDAAGRDADRAAYVASKSDPRMCYAETTICTGVHGKADYGRRYFEFASVFGANAVTANLCEDEPMERLFERFVAMLEARLLP